MSEIVPLEVTEYADPDYPAAPGEMQLMIRSLRYRTRDGTMYSDGELVWGSWRESTGIVKRDSGIYDASPGGDHAFYAASVVSSLAGGPYRTYHSSYPARPLPSGFNGAKPVSALAGYFGYHIFQRLTADDAIAPFITGEPENIDWRSGNPLNLSVKAGGHGRLKYQWFKDNEPIPGATDSSYYKPVAVPGDSGSYHVVITNNRGSVASQTASVVFSGIGHRTDAGDGESCVRGRVWFDGSGSGDGIYQGEIAVRDTRITILRYNEDEPTSRWHAIVNSLGTYEFTGLSPGWYEVFFDVPLNYKTTLTDVGEDDAIDSDVSAFPSGPTTAASSRFYLSEGECIENLSMGLVKVPGVFWTEREINLYEGDSTRTIAMDIELSFPSDDDITLPWATLIGSAVSHQDFVQDSGFIRFRPGETTASIEIAVRGDLRKEPDEFFFIALTVNPLQRVFSDHPDAAIHIANDDDGALIEEPPPGVGIPQKLYDWTLPAHQGGWVIDEALSSEDSTVWRALSPAPSGSIARHFPVAGTLYFQWKIETASPDYSALFFSKNGMGLDKILIGDSGGWQTVVAKLDAGDTPSISYIGRIPDSTTSAFVKDLRFIPEDPEANAAPVFTSTPQDEALQNQTYGYAPDVTDPDGDTVTLTAPVKPSWLSFDGNTLTGTHPSGNDRIEDVAIVATDSRGASSRQGFSILIHSGSPTHPLRWKMNKFSGRAGDLTVSGDQADPDGDDLSNAMERALDLNPLQPDQERAKIRVAGNAGGGAVLRIAVPANPPADTTYSIQSLTPSLAGRASPFAAPTGHGRDPL